MFSKNNILFFFLLLTAALMGAAIIPATVCASGNYVTRETSTGTEYGDPVLMNSGSYGFSLPLVSFGGTLPLEWSLSYRTDNYEWMGFAVPMQSLVRHTAVPVAELAGLEGDEFTAETLRPGELVCFKGMTLLGTPSIPYQLKQTAAFYYLADPFDQKIYIFQRRAEIIQPIAAYMDRKGNCWKYTYSSDDSVRAEDGLGRFFEFGNNKFTDFAGRTVSYVWSGKELRSMTDQMGNTTNFTYSDGLISQIKRPMGNIPYTQSYAEAVLNGEKAWRVSSQTDAEGNKTSFQYDTAVNKVTVTQPDLSKLLYEHQSNTGAPKSFTDALGNRSEFASAKMNRVTSFTDRRGNTSLLDYHSTGRTASITNAKGDKVTYTYTPKDQTLTNPISGETVSFTFHDITRIDWPDGSSEEFSYDDKGNVVQWKNRAGHIWKSEYNERGQTVKTTNPEGGIVEYTYNADGTPASRKDSDSPSPETYEYDKYKRLVKLNRPDGKSVTIAYNDNDQIVSVSDELNHAHSYAYDKNGNLTEITDPAGKKTKYEYDAMDRLLKITDRLEKVFNLTYDAMGRLESLEDPNKLKAEFDYNGLNLVKQIKSVGKTWAYAYDNEGTLTSSTGPEGYGPAYTCDKLGEIVEMRDATGKSVKLTRDKMNRITSVTDRLNRTTSFGYDSRGLITSVEMPQVGKAAYTLNSLGTVAQIQDLNGKAWKMDYTVMGRLETVTDPLENKTQYDADSRGRIYKTAFPDGKTMTQTYDDAGNLIRSLYSDGPDLNFTYDVSDRLVSADKLSLTWDSEGRITRTGNEGVNFDAAYDDGGRLKTLAYNNNALTVTYAYDPETGLLSSVSDTLSGASLSFSYNDDLRLTGISRSNVTAAAFTLDNRGRIIGIKDGNFIDIAYTLDDAGQITGADMKTIPLDPATVTGGRKKDFSYDSACQVSKSGYSYDKIGRLEVSPGHAYKWDGASRLIGIDDAVLTYNGAGDLISRTKGDVTARYFYNYAVDLTPIAAEYDASSDKWSYFVWTPRGQLLYMIRDGKAYFYHFDVTGSVIALSGADGSVTDKYAYTPYGRLLKHEGDIVQPFTFAGRKGVRQEDAGGTLYHMRARYYDAETASFLSRDVVWPQMENPLSLNPYQYVHRDPIRWTDPKGTDHKAEYEIKNWEPGEKWVDVFEPPVTNKQPPVEGEKEVEVVKDALIDNFIDFLNEKIGEFGEHVAKKALAEELEKKFIKEYGEKLGKELAKKAAGKIVKGVLSKLAVVTTLYDGAVSAKQLYDWANMDPTERGHSMSQETSYQLVEYLEQSSSTGRDAVRAVGRCVSWLVGD